MPGGKMMIVGHKKGLRGPPIALEKELTLQYVELSPLEYNPALKLLSERKVDVKPLITHRISLDDLPTYLDKIARGQLRGVKVIVNP
jgi:threonine dehydrogenase-like Zn-dependent dehydrogenase